MPAYDDVRIPAQDCFIIYSHPRQSSDMSSSRKRLPSSYLMLGSTLIVIGYRRAQTVIPSFENKP